MLNESNQIVSATDYDCWGYPLDGRSYQSDNTDYKFTGKQRDTETGWDYFGARYYDARIARWGSVDLLFEKHIGWTPYNYVLRNPMVLIDPDGRQLKVTNGRPGEKDIETFYDDLNISGLNYENGKVIYSGDYSDLNKNEGEDLIIDVIEGRNVFRDSGLETNVKVNVVLMDKDYYILPDDETKQKRITNAESYEGSVRNKDGSVTAIQYFHMGIIGELDSKGVYRESKVVKHGVVEAILGAVFRATYGEAHSRAMKYVSYEDKNSSYIGVGYNKSKTILYAYPKKGKAEPVWEINYNK